MTGVEIANLALDQLGEENITALTDEPHRAKVCNRLIDTAVWHVLSLQDWQCAVARATLAAAAGSVDTDLYEFTYHYDLPADYVRFIGFIVSGDRDYYHSHDSVNVPHIIEANILYCDLSTARIRYVQDVSDDVTQLSEMLAYAVAMYLATLVSVPLAKTPELQQQAQGQFAWALQLAERENARFRRGQIQPKPGLARR